MKFSKVFSLIAAVVIISIAAMLIMFETVPASAQNYAKQDFIKIMTKVLNVSGLATFQGGMAGSTINTAELPIDASVAFTPYSVTETITSGGVISPVRPFIAISAAGAVTTSTITAIVDGWNDGQICTMTNMGANPITVKNSANTLLGGDVVLGQYDTLSVWWDGYDWIRFSSANN